MGGYGAVANMGGYRAIANLPYDTIGKEIDSQIKLDKEVREIRFLEVAGKELRYDTYVLKGTDIPAVDNSDFVGAAPMKELSDIINSKLRKGSLPKEIRVILQDHKKDSWDIFFKQ